MEELITASVVDFALAIFVGFVAWRITSHNWKNRFIELEKADKTKQMEIDRLTKKVARMCQESFDIKSNTEWDLILDYYIPARRIKHELPSLAQVRLLMEMVDNGLVSQHELAYKLGCPSVWHKYPVTKFLKEHQQAIDSLKANRKVEQSTTKIASVEKAQEEASRLDLAHLPGIEKFPYTANYSILTIPERRFYLCLCRWADGHGFAIAPKVRMQDLLSLKKGLKKDDYLAWFWEINQRHVDFTVLDTQKNYRRTLFCIELDGDSHLTEKQRRIDVFKNRALASAGIMLFRHNMPKGKPSNEVFFNLEQLRKELDQDLAKAAGAQKQGGKR